jgi:hypothetical protein
MRARPRLALVAAGLVTMVALTGCGADRGEDGSGPGRDAAPEAGADGGAPGEGVPPAGDPSVPGGQAGGALVDGRSIIFTGSMTVRVEDVDRAAGEAGAVATRYGGFVGGDDRSSDTDGARARMVLRVPSDRFATAVEDLAGLGDEESRELTTEDVTEEVVDLQTRIDTARASVDRTRELLERATSISDIVAIEEELSVREGRLASLQARQRALDDLTTLSTITISLIGPDTPVEEPQPESGFLPGLRAGWNGFLTAVGIMLTGLGWLLPWVVALGIPAAGAVWWSRRRGRRPARQPDHPSGA